MRADSFVNDGMAIGERKTTRAVTERAVEPKTAAKHISNAAEEIMREFISGEH